MKKLVIATLEVAGFHQWVDAPVLAIHLRARHRHLFRFVVAVPVMDSDREIEFHLLRVRMQDALATLYPQGLHGFEFEGRSCEMLAEELMVALERDPDSVPVAWCEVWEDREHGARVEAE